MRTFSGCGKQALRPRCGVQAPGPAGSQARKPLRVHMPECGPQQLREHAVEGDLGIAEEETGRRQASGPAGPGELHTPWGAERPEAVGGCPGDAGP